MPVGRNAIPLRKAPDGAVIKTSREAKALREKKQTRKELEEEAAIALIEAHTGPAGAHDFRTTSPARPPMPFEKNRLPLRKADAVSARTRALQYKRKQEQEQRAMALAAAEAAHDRLVAKLKAQGRDCDPAHRRRHPTQSVSAPRSAPWWQLSLGPERYPEGQGVRL